MNTLLVLGLLVSAQPANTAVSPTGFKGIDPQVATRGNEVFVVCGSSNQIMEMCSKDNGRTFSLPIKLPTSGRLSVGMRRGPRIVTTNKNVVVTIISGTQGGGKDGDLLAFRSADSGRTWLGPTVVSDVPGAAREGLHAMAASKAGIIGCAWLDLRNKGTEVWAATSTDGGATWSKNVKVYRSPDGHVCECCHPSIAFGARGEIYVMFRNWLLGSRDMYLATSKDMGRSFEPPQKLGTGTWPLNACPMDGGAISVTESGSVTTTWRRENSVYACQPLMPEQQLGPGIQPWIAPDQNGYLVIWQQGDRLVTSQDGRGPITIGEGGNSAIVCTPKGPLAVWADSKGSIWSHLFNSN